MIRQMDSCHFFVCNKLDTIQTSEDQIHRRRLVNVGIGNLQPNVGADGAFSFQFDPLPLLDGVGNSIAYKADKYAGV